MYTILRNYIQAKKKSKMFALHIIIVFKLKQPQNYNYL